MKFVHWPFRKFITIYIVSQKTCTCMSILRHNLDRFSTLSLLECWTRQEICSKTVVRFFTAP